MDECEDKYHCTGTMKFNREHGTMKFDREYGTLPSLDFVRTSEKNSIASAMFVVFWDINQEQNVMWSYFTITTPISANNFIILCTFKLLTKRHSAKLISED